jgi:homoserine O-acetyltransferase
LKDDSYYDIDGRFQVDSYLDYNGNKFSKSFDPLSYLYLTKAIDIFDLSHGFDSLEDALKNFEADLTLISFSGDLLFLPEESDEVVKAMNNIGKEKYVKHFEIESDYGHDAFLIEFDKFQNLIENEIN